MHFVPAIKTLVELKDAMIDHVKRLKKRGDELKFGRGIGNDLKDGIERGKKALLEDCMVLIKHHEETVRKAALDALAHLEGSIWKDRDATPRMLKDLVDSLKSPVAGTRDVSSASLIL